MDVVLVNNLFPSTRNVVGIACLIKYLGFASTFGRDELEILVNMKEKEGERFSNLE